MDSKSELGRSAEKMWTGHSPPAWLSLEEGAALSAVEKAFVQNFGSELPQPGRNTGKSEG